MPGLFTMAPMSDITELQERLALYKATERRILEGNQSWEVNGHKFTRANLAEIQRMITALEHRLAAARQGGAFGHSVTVFGGRRG